MTEVERKEDFRPEEFIDWIKDEPAGSETVSDHKSGDAYGFKDFFDTLADTLSARAGGDDRDLIDALEEKKKKKAAEEAAKKAAAKRAESEICDIFGADDDDERKRGIAFKSPFAEMTEEELDAALKKANKNTYWEFGLHTEKKRRAGKVESFIYEKEGTRIPVLPTYTNKMEREVCGEPVAVSFGDLPRTKNVNSIGNPNAIRYTTHLEIHFDITEGAETKEGKSVAYMKAQSFLAAAYRGDTLGGKPVRRFRLNNMSEEELKAWGEVRAAFEGQGKKIEFILTDEQQKVFDRYAAKFAEITKLNRELVGAEKVAEMTVEKDTERTSSESMVEPTESKTEDTSETSKDVVSEEEKTPAESKTVIEPEDKPIIDVEVPKTTDSEDVAEADSEPMVEPTESKTEDTSETSKDVVSEEEAEKEAENAVREFFNGMDEIEKTAMKDAKKAEREAKKAEKEAKKAEREAENAVRKFFKDMDKIEKTAMKDAKKAEREAKKAKKEAEKEAKAEKKSRSRKSDVATNEIAVVTDENAEAIGESGASSVIGKEASKAVKTFDLSNEKDKRLAREAIAAAIAREYHRDARFASRFTSGRKTVENDITTYANLYLEKAEEFIDNSSSKLSVQDIFKAVKREVGKTVYSKVHKGYYSTGAGSYRVKTGKVDDNLIKIKNKQNGR